MNIGSKGKDLILRLLDFNLCHKIFLENAGLPSVYSSVPTVFALCSISREARKRTDGLRGPGKWCAGMSLDSFNLYYRQPSALNRNCVLVL